jgi:tight adherence protein B
VSPSGAPALPAFTLGPLDVRAALLVLLLGLAVLSLAVAALAPGPARSRKPSRLEGWLRQELRRARLFDARVRDVAAASAIGAVLGGALMQAISGWPVYGAVGAAFAATIPVLAISLRAQHLHAEVQVGLVDAIRQLRDALRSQASVRGGITLLAEKGPPALRAYFQHVLDRERALGGFDRGLRDLRMRLSDAVGDQLVDALLVSLSTGGELLSQTLDDLAAQAQAELEIRASIRAEQWKARVTALALALTPGLLLLWMRLVAPDAVAAFDLPVGQAVMFVCAVMCGVGYVAVLRVGQVPERRRLYADAGSVEGS